MTPPYVVLAAIDGVMGGGGGPWAYVTYTVVDSTSTCVPYLPAEWMAQLFATDTLADVQTRTEAGLKDYLQANYGLDPATVSFTWLT